jgi:hypothetical protein
MSHRATGEKPQNREGEEYAVELSGRRVGIKIPQVMWAQVPSSFRSPGYSERGIFWMNIPPHGMPSAESGGSVNCGSGALAAFWQRFSRFECRLSTWFL